MKKFVRHTDDRADTALVPAVSLPRRVRLRNGGAAAAIRPLVQLFHHRV